MSRFIALLTVAVSFTAAGCATTPLNQAIRRKDLSSVKQLVGTGANVNHIDGTRTLSAPLPQAVIYGTPEIVEYLVKHGAAYHNEALERAAWLNRVDMLEALIAAGVDPDQPVRVANYEELLRSARARRTAAAPRPQPGNLDDAAYDRMRASAGMAPKKRAVSSDIDSPTRRGTERPNDFALVIGVEEYQSLPKADFGVRDAATVRKHFEAIGVPARNIIALEGAQATGSKMKSYLQQWLPRNVKPESTVFVYYSGHGAPDPENGDAYLVPWDGDPMFLATSAYPLKQFYAELSQLKAKRVIVALDACFSGSGGRSVLAKGARPLVSKVDEGVPEAANLTVLAAASGSEITGSLDEQGHGIFTYHFLKGLAGGAKTPRALHDYLKPLVQDDARRQNREQSPTLAGSGADAPF